jgi:hypothetical protein
MTQLLSLFNQVFGNQSKSNDLEQFIQNQNYISNFKKSLNDLVEAWIEARSEQAKYYSKHSHIE